MVSLRDACVAVRDAFGIVSDEVIEGAFGPEVLTAVRKTRAALAQEAEGDDTYLPGQWRCPKCAFTLLQKTLYARDGSVGPNNKPGEKCPNCDSPLWRVTYKQGYEELEERFEQYIIENPRAQEAGQAILGAIDLVDEYIDWKLRTKDEGRPDPHWEARVATARALKKRLQGELR